MSVEARLARLNACRDTAELRSTLVETCAGMGEVLSLTAICGQHPERTLCVIDFVPGSTDVGSTAAAIGGRVFGFSSVIVPLALGDGFSCPKRQHATDSSCACSPR